MFKSLLSSSAKSVLKKNQKQSFVNLVSQSKFASSSTQKSNVETMVLEKEPEGNASSLSVPFFAPSESSSQSKYNRKDEEVHRQVQKTVLENGFTVLSTVCTIALNRKQIISFGLK